MAAAAAEVASASPSKSTEKPTQPSRSIWSRAGSNSKAGFDKLWGWADKLGAPVNRLSNKLGSEAFWPTTLDKESEKAARIIRSFCKDGFYDEELRDAPEGGPKQKQKVIKKIPEEVIKNAKGLAIFTTMRTGLWISGAGGSGIVVARKEDGTWGPPIGIMLHTAGLGFLVGVDIYDCVLVLNTEQAVEAFSKWRATLGGEISVVAGPVGAGAVLDSEVHKRQSPIFSYLKSRGFYAGVQIDGTVLIERTDENERFYGQRIPAMDILMGKTQSRERELEMLMETLKAAEGKNARTSLLPDGPAPADYEVVESDHQFGVPDRDDPDPYGVLALENAGMVIKEAGSKVRASVEQFEFNPKPTSPVFRSSFDGSASQRSVRSSWRESRIDRPYRTSEIGVQTDFEPPSTPPKRASGPPPPLPPRQSIIHATPPTLPPRESIRMSTLATSPPAVDEEHRDLGITLEDNESPETDEPLTKRVSHSVEGFTQTTPVINGFQQDSAEAIEKKVEEQGGVKAQIPDSDNQTEHVTSDTADRKLDTVASEQQNDPVDAEPEKKSQDLSQEKSVGTVQEGSGDVQGNTVNKEKEAPKSTSNDEKDDKRASILSKNESLVSDIDDDDFDDVVVHEVHEARPPPQAIQARVVSVPKRETPQLPSRNPGRAKPSSGSGAYQPSDASSVRSLAASNADIEQSTSHEDTQHSSITSNSPSLKRASSDQSNTDDMKAEAADKHITPDEAKAEPSAEPKPESKERESAAPAIDATEKLPNLKSAPKPSLPDKSAQRQKSPAVSVASRISKFETKAEDKRSPSRGRSLARSKSPTKSATPADRDESQYSEADIPSTSNAQLSPAKSAEVKETQASPDREKAANHGQKRISMAAIRGGLHERDDDDDEDESRSPSVTRRL